MFLIRKKTYKLTKEETQRIKESWSKFIEYVKCSEEEFFALWDSGVDLVPLALANGHMKSNMDH